MTPRRWLALVLLLYALLGSAFTLIVPLGEAPDEIDHVLYVRHLVETGLFPVMRPVTAQNETMEANQPPLYYLLNAAVQRPFPQTASADLPRNLCYTFDPHDNGRAHFYLHSRAEAAPFDTSYLAFRVSRLLSVLLGAATVAVAYLLGRQMAPARPNVALLAAAVLAFNPQFLFMMASVNNDVLMALLGAALLATAVRAATHPTPRVFALGGVLMGLALLTKFALLAFWPLLFIALAVPLFTGADARPFAARLRERLRPMLLHATLITALPLLIGGWWYARAQRLYGDPLAWDVHLQAKGSEVLRLAPLSARDLLEFAQVHFQSYWGWFGWLKIQLPGWAYGMLLLFVALAVAGVAVHIRRWPAWRKRPLRFEASQVAVGFNVAAVTATYAALLRYIQTINWSGYQGRLAFGAAAAVAGLLALGWLHWTTAVAPQRRAARMAGWLPAVCLLALSSGSLIGLVRPAYARPALFEPPPDVRRVCVATAGLQVEAVTFPDETRPGGALPVTLYTYGLAPGAESLQLRLEGRNGRILAEQEWPLTWQSGEGGVMQTDLRVAPDASPALAQLRFGPAGDLQTVGAVVIRPLEQPPAPAAPVSGARFGGQLALLGYDRSDDTLTLHWQALAPMAQDYTTFVHFVDAQGNLIAQQDGQPQDGAYPTSVWAVGETVLDTKPLPEGAQDAAGVLVGVYLLETGERLLLERPLEGDRFTLP